MKYLNPIDNAFLLAERRHQPLHVGALSLFKVPENAPDDFCAQLAQRLRESTTASPPFNHRLHTQWGINSWDTSSEFDIYQHFVHLALPKPGRVLELLAMVSRVHSAHLDRAYPLWRSYLIEGLEDGRIALYSKIHHAVVDGVAGIRLMLKSMADDPETSLDMPAPWEMTGRHGGGTEREKIRRFQNVGRLIGQGLSASAPVARQLRQTWQEIQAHNPGAVSSLQAPRCVLNGKITGSRRFAAQSYSTARVKAIASAIDGTSNDVVLALCASALRRYLLEQEALPEKPLVAAVPVSIRRDDSESGNEISMALANLGTHLADPVERLKVVQASMDYTKKVLRSMSPAQIMAYTLGLFAPGAATLLPGFGRERSLANVVISHVPGPREPVYWQGCELDGIYPASLVLDGFALNITLISRHDQIDFGIIACRKTVPGVQRLLDYLGDAISELELALGLPSPDGKDIRLVA